MRMTLTLNCLRIFLAYTDLRVEVTVNGILKQNVHCERDLKILVYYI